MIVKFSKKREKISPGAEGEMDIDEVCCSEFLNINSQYSIATAFCAKNFCSNVKNVLFVISG